MLQRPIAVDWAVPKKEYEEQSGAKEVKKEEIEDQDQAELDEEEEDVQDEEVGNLWLVLILVIRQKIMIL